MFGATPAVAGKTKKRAPLFHELLEEAQGIAHFSRYGPVALKKAMQGKLTHSGRC